MYEQSAKHITDVQAQAQNVASRKATGLSVTGFGSKEIWERTRRLDTAFITAWSYPYHITLYPRKNELQGIKRWLSSGEVGR